jgi:cytochrome c
MKKTLVVLLVACAIMFGITHYGHSKGNTEEAQGLVKKAIAFYKAEGKEKAFSEISNPQGKFAKADLYVFVYDMKGVAMARPVQKGLIGKNIIDLKDPDGKFFVKERIDIVKTKGQGWQDYKFLNPSTNKTETKTAYVEGHDNYVFGCGVYK